MIFALGATLAAIPLLLVGHSATANDDEPAAVTTEQAAEDPGPTAPPKGASVVVTSPVPDDATTSTSGSPLTEIAMATTPTTRPLSTTTTAPRRATTTTTTPPPRSEEPGNVDDGQASWYDGTAGTCVHRTLAMGTIVNVTNVVNGRSVTCRVADRGPYVAGRVIDLERSAFAKLASTSDGVITVRIEW